MLDNLLDAVIGIDEAGKVLSFNRSACKFFGYTLEEAKTLSFNVLIEPEDGQMLAVALRQYLKPGYLQSLVQVMK